MSYTKGEWIIARGSHAYPFEVLADTKTIVQVESAKTITETEANARLIAQSPKMFEVCSELAEIFPENSMSEMDAADFKDRANRIWTAAERAKQVIAKAEGED